MAMPLVEARVGTPSCGWLESSRDSHSTSKDFPAVHNSVPVRGFWHRLGITSQDRHGQGQEEEFRRQKGEKGIGLSSSARRHMNQSNAPPSWSNNPANSSLLHSRPKRQPSRPPRARRRLRTRPPRSKAATPRMLISTRSSRSMRASRSSSSRSPRLCAMPRHVRAQPRR
jgi:hypothetical protein